MAREFGVPQPQRLAPERCRFDVLICSLTLAARDANSECSAYVVF